MEVCADRLDSVLAAAEGGASRIELCSAMSEGGLTPTPGLMRGAKKMFGKDVFALVRPRAGDFLYTEEELEVMREDLRTLRDAGADGFVFGCLTKDGEVDKEACSSLMSECRGLPATFHRAFDMTRDPSAAITTIISLGFSRLLTSGCSATALQGKELIRRLSDEHSKKISIMPGGGVSESNLRSLLEAAPEVREFHASARKRVASKMVFKNEGCSMGGGGEDEYSCMVTDAGRVREMVGVFNEVRGGGRGK